MFKKVSGSDKDMDVFTYSNFRVLDIQIFEFWDFKYSNFEGLRGCLDV